MSNFKNAVLTAALVGIIAAPASAAKLTVNGNFTTSWTYQNSDIEPDSLFGNGMLDLKIGFTEGENIAKLNVPLQVKGFESGKVLSYRDILAKGWYFDLNTSAFNLSISDASDDLHKFVPVNDPMGLGNTLGDAYDNTLDEILHLTSLDLYLPNYKFITADPNVLIKLNGSIGIVDYVGYYANSNINEREPNIFDLYGEGVILSTLEENVNTFILRGTADVSENLKIGSTVTYSSYIDDNVSTNTDLKDINLGIDFTGKIPFIGGNYKIAGAASITNYFNLYNNGTDELEYVKDGHAFLLELSDISLGMFKFGVNFAGVQENAFSPFVDNNSIMYYDDNSDNDMKLGVNLATVIDIDNVKLNLELTDTLSAPFFKKFVANEAKLTATLNPTDKLSVLASIENYADFVDKYSQTALGFGVNGKVNDGLQLNGEAEVLFGRVNTLIADIYAIYDVDLPASQNVLSSDLKIAGLFGYNGYNGLQANNILNTVFYKLFAGYNANITDKVSATAGMYFGKDVINPNELEIVGSVTAKYELNSAISLSGTYTYRNWGILGQAANVSNHFANAAVTFDVTDNTSLSLTWGNDGLASESVVNNENAKPWSYLAMFPESAEMNISSLGLDLKISF